MAKVAEWDLGDRLLIYIESDCPEDVKCEYLQRLGLKLWFESKDTVCVVGDGLLHHYIADIDEFGGIYTGDIISISDKGYTSIMYSEQNGEIDVFMTNKCNSNCVMCPLPEAVRRKKQENHEEWVKEYINILPNHVRYINITGGEPTLSQQFFIDMLLAMKEKFTKSDFQLLTNGRSSADKNFLQKVLQVVPGGMRFAIPVHSADSGVHDMITQSKDSFIQTDRGIKNLLHEQQKVEVRIVVSRKNADTLVDTAKYIVDNYKGVFCVNFVGMEMMGNAALNKESLWIDYSEAFKKSKDAIDILVGAGIDVQLYNFPLCAVNRGYWHIAVKSITDYKIRYMDECDECSVKEICGGFFYSTKQIMKPRVTPVKGSDEN